MGNGNLNKKTVKNREGKRQKQVFLKLKNDISSNESNKLRFSISTKEIGSWTR